MVHWVALCTVEPLFSVFGFLLPFMLGPPHLSKDPSRVLLLPPCLLLSTQLEKPWFLSPGAVLALNLF